MVKAIEIIGEPPGQLSEEAKAELPGIPWRNILGMRNRLVHAYFDINLSVLWKTVMEGLPPIIDELQRALPEDA